MHISFHKAWKLSALHDEGQSLTELRAVCTLGVEWGVRFGTSLAVLCPFYQN
jgi:hypothetical protein